jgi:hypothetical protein
MLNNRKKITIIGKNQINKITAEKSGSWIAKSQCKLSILIHNITKILFRGKDIKILRKSHNMLKKKLITLRLGRKNLIASKINYSTNIMKNKSGKIIISFKVNHLFCRKLKCKMNIYLQKNQFVTSKFNLHNKRYITKEKYKITVRFQNLCANRSITFIHLFQITNGIVFQN